MAAQSFKTAHIVLAEPKAEMSRVVYTALSERGQGKIVTCRDANGLHEAMSHELVDVLLCDIDLPELKFRDSMQRIRQNELGRNPFVHIIAMVATSGRDQIHGLIGAGVDDLIRKPMPPDRVAARLDNLTRPRKPFAVAETYIGPNRRKTPRVGDAQYLVQVPNSLRSKSIDRTHPTQVQEAIDRAWVEVQDRRIRSRRNAIGVLTRRILGFYDGQGTPAELRRDLGYLLAQGEGLIRRHWNTESAHVAEMAACMTGVARRIMKASDAPAPKDIKLMPHLAGATRISAQSPAESIDTVREIVGLIRGYLMV